MKSLAIIGMMFCSVGLFAQQSENIDSPKKEKVCVIERAEAGNNVKLKLAPMRKDDVRRTTARCGKAKVAQKAQVKDERMMVPLKRKNGKVDVKM
ncbi:MAG: hypothetical protein AB8B56_18215 [Crocinitomicaceae bacterium]